MIISAPVEKQHGLMLFPDSPAQRFPKHRTDGHDRAAVRFFTHIRHAHLR